MVKASYTDEEIRQILHSLFMEKKRNKDLTRKLQLQVKEVGASGEEEAVALREQVQKLKQMVQAANVEKTPENEQVVNLRKQLHESQKHSAQLEHVIQFLRGKSEEAHLESKHLEVEFNESQENISNLKQQLVETQTSNEALTKKQLQDQEEKKELQEELNAVQQQFASLKNQVLNSKKTQETAETALVEANKSLADMQRTLSERMTSLGDVEEEIRTIKDTLVEGIKQAQEIEKQYLEAIDEKVSASNEADQLMKQNNQLQEEIRLLKGQIADNHHHEQEMQAETGQQMELLMRQRDATLQQHRDIQHRVDQLHKENGDLKSRSKDLEERALRAETKLTEQEFEIKTAHQHLAKKVKETTILSEQTEELKLRLLEVQKTADSDRSKMAELRNKIHDELQDRKHLEDKLQEQRKQSEEQSNKWEEKYFRLCEKLQDAETRNKELQALEERHNHMQALLANLGNFMNKTGLPPAPQPQHDLHIPPRGKRASKTEESTDLFNEPSDDYPRYKKDLFDK